VVQEGGDLGRLVEAQAMRGEQELGSVLRLRPRPRGTGSV